MKHAPIGLTGLSLGLLLLGGCDDQAAQAARSASALTEAVATVNVAEQGYVSGGGAADADYEAFRQEKLATAETQLKALITSGDAGTRASAQRLLGSVKASIARSRTEAAENAFAVVRGRGTGLFNHLSAVERVQALLLMRGGNDESVSAALSEGAQMVATSQAGLRSTMSELTAQRDAAAEKAKQRSNAAASQFETAQEFEQAAFTADLPESRQGAYRSAYAAQLQGEAAAMEARQAQIEADNYAAELAPLETELNLWNQMQQQLADLQSRAQTDREDARQDVSAGQAAKVTTIAAVADYLKAMQTYFDQEVQAPLQAAEAAATEAIDHLSKALSAGGGGGIDRSTVQVEQAAAQAMLVHILTRQATTHRGMASIYEALMSNPALAETPLAEAARQSQGQLSATAQQAAERARTLIDEILAAAPEQGSDAADPAVVVADAVRSYRAQLN